MCLCKKRKKNNFNVFFSMIKTFKLFLWPNCIVFLSFCSWAFPGQSPCRVNPEIVIIQVPSGLQVYQLSPPNPAPCHRTLKWIIFPFRLCQTVVGQHGSHLFPLQHAENNLECACASFCLCDGSTGAVSRIMQNPVAGGPALAGKAR